MGSGVRGQGLVRVGRLPSLGTLCPDVLKKPLQSSSALLARQFTFEVCSTNKCTNLVQLMEAS
jgi:hypothetical protein